MGILDVSSFKKDLSNWS